MSTPIAAEGLDVDEHGHILVQLNGTPSEEWTAAFREHWGKAEPPGATPIKKDALSHIAGKAIVFRGIDVDGWVEQCKRFTQDSIKYANDYMRRVEAERDARIRSRITTSGKDRGLEAERAKAHKVKFE